MIIDVHTRDLGYGAEEYLGLDGSFVGGYDTWGKREFLTTTGTRLYLFDDEWSEIDPCDYCDCDLEHCADVRILDRETATLHYPGEKL